MISKPHFLKKASNGKKKLAFIISFFVSLTCEFAHRGIILGLATIIPKHRLLIYPDDLPKMF